jgi:hypothetical protein
VGELYTALNDAVRDGTEIFLDVYGNGDVLLKLTNARDGNYLFLYPESDGTIHAYILQAMPNDGGSLKEYSLTLTEVT